MITRLNTQRLFFGFLLCVATVYIGGCVEHKGDVLGQATEAMHAGQFTNAEQLLSDNIADADSPAARDLSTLREIIRRIRVDYSLTPEQMLAKLKDYIPDVTADDVKRWTAAGELQYRTIDGNTCYFKREPSNLFRFCSEARDRRKDTGEPQPAGESFDLVSHVVSVLNRSIEERKDLVQPVRHQVTYSLRVNNDHSRVRKGATVRCWLPFPQEYRQQRDVKLISADPPTCLVAENGSAHRTLYFEQVIEDATQPPVFSATFEFTTYAFCPDLNPARARPYDSDSELYRTYTQERPPHITFTPELQQVVRQVVGDSGNPLANALRLYRWVCENISYCSEMEYSTIENISDKALSTRRGDCGVQGLLFITLCRAAGIPARWQSGWESLPNRCNMHDWAEFYVEPWGWLPADPSYGLQDHPDKRVQEFYCGHMDSYRMIVNLDYARELCPPKNSFRSEPNDFQRGEIEIDGHNLYFDEWQWTFDVHTVPVGGGINSMEEALDAVVPKAMHEGDVPGAVILVGKNVGGVYLTWQKAYGYKQLLPQPVPMTTDAIFGLASMTKPIATGTSLMLLSDWRKVDISNAVANYLPEFDTETKRDVTVKQLMTHMSGEQPYIHAGKRKEIEDQYGFPCRDALRRYVRELKLARKPGEAVVYSCLNAILASEVVRAVSGMEMSDFAAQNIFGPLGMVDTGFTPSESLDSRLVPSTRTDYGRGGGGFLLGQVHDPLAAAQGGVSGNAGLFSTAADLSRFAQMMLNGGELDGVRILKEETVKAMTSIQNPGGKSTNGSVNCKGLFWDIYCPHEGDTGLDAVYAYGHTGYTGTAIRIYPEAGVYAIVLTNRVHPDDSGKVNGLRRAVWQAVGQVLLSVEP